MDLTNEIQCNNKNDEERNSTIDNDILCIQNNKSNQNNQNTNNKSTQAPFIKNKTIETNTIVYLNQQKNNSRDPNTCFNSNTNNFNSNTNNFNSNTNNFNSNTNNFNADDKKEQTKRDNQSDTESVTNVELKLKEKLLKFAFTNKKNITEDTTKSIETNKILDKLPLSQNDSQNRLPISSKINPKVDTYIYKNNISKSRSIDVNKLTQKSYLNINKDILTQKNNQNTKDDISSQRREGSVNNNTLSQEEHFDISENILTQRSSQTVNKNTLTQEGHPNINVDILSQRNQNNNSNRRETISVNENVTQINGNQGSRTPKSSNYNNNSQISRNASSLGYFTRNNINSDLDENDTSFQSNIIKLDNNDISKMNLDLPYLNGRKRPPGPAGLLSLKKSKRLERERNGIVDESYNEELVGQDLFFQTSTWIHFLKSNDFPEYLPSNYLKFILSNNNEFNGILTHSISRIFKGEYQFDLMIPNLAVVIKQIINKDDHANVLLADPSGEIQGSIEKKIFKRHRKLLCSGVTLILKDTPIIYINNKTQYISITLDNMVEYFIFSKENQNDAERITIK
ncbi:hypothetical protein K502DRAFT_323799 [Neoconidiobolus thromboides FSU 785]|nr:hypothetical protein K502DRAFT_323799 [Neoconidiobolus thromboides FSU 785]